MGNGGRDASAEQAIGVDAQGASWAGIGQHALVMVDELQTVS